ncbi:hypothetical protein M8J76_003983 [Diaphorina citri]|nr:hypothetical protein M8J76_003983 [Diaphorina citri]
MVSVSNLGQEVQAPLRKSTKAKDRAPAPLDKVQVCAKCSLDKHIEKLQVCTECKRCYHRSCIPKNYDYILDSDDDDDDDEDFFMCPGCKIEVVDGHSKEEVQSDESFF